MSALWYHQADKIVQMVLVLRISFRKMLVRTQSQFSRSTKFRHNILGHKVDIGEEEIITGFGSIRLANICLRLWKRVPASPALRAILAKL